MKHVNLISLVAGVFILIVSCGENKQSAQADSKETKAIVENEVDEIENKIKEAMSAAPSSISENATILDYPEDPNGEKIVLRKGTNEWFCLPDNPHMPGKNPMCIDRQMKELHLKLDVVKK